MRKLFFFAFTLLIAVSMQAQTYWNGTSNKVFSGSGTQSDPYLISTPEQLAGLAERTNVDKEDFAGKYIKLTADIYLTNFNDLDTANWKEWIPIARTNRQQQSGGGSTTDSSFFCGHFDGDGHTIYNLYYNGGAGWGDDWDPDDPLFDPAAFIGALDLNAWNNALFTNVKGGTIENLNMANGHMCGIQGTSFLANNTTDGAIIRNCHVQGYFRGTGDMYPGSLVAYNHGLIENCSANVTTQGTGGGGLVYTNEEGGIIRNCTTAGTMTTIAASAAGLVYNNYGLVEQCQSSVNISGSRGKTSNGKTASSLVAGFCHVNNSSGVIRECASTGSISASSAANLGISSSAGFCIVNLGQIESSYCTGDLIHVSPASSGPSIAMFVVLNGEYGSYGYYSAGTILNCYSASHHIYNVADCESLALGFIRNNLYYKEITNYYDPAPLISRPAFCWYNDDELSATAQANYRPYCEARSSAFLHSQAFVDTLNLCASFLGTSQWELRDGIPQPTGVRTKNTSVFFAGGEGTKENPYQIATKAQLKNFRWMVNHGSYDFCGEYIKQTADIELNAPMAQWEYQMPEEWEPIGGYTREHPHFQKTGNAETAFRGTYDGDFHEVKNMYIDNNRIEQGFFGFIGSSGLNGSTNLVGVRNLAVTDAYVTANGGGIIAGNADKYVIFSQCRTSGQMIAANNGYGMGALIGGDAYNKWWLNCSSSARITGASGEVNGIKGSIYGGLSWYAFQNDTLINYLFTGNINNGASGAIQHGSYTENSFTDGNIANITYDGSSETTNGVRTTAYLQSKEFVNILNHSVSRWNASHDEEWQLNYWEWREGDYPKLTRTLSYTPAIVTFNSNGGNAVLPKTVVPGSRIEMPVRPLKDGQLFVAWYKDAALTQIFDFYKDSVQSDMTLYARWRNDEREDIDITPFNNKFTSTYHIQTAAQLRAFSQLQNGLYDWSSGSPVQTAAPRDFTGKTIVLDNDILLCDTTDWQYWGSVAYGLPWKPIGSMVGATGESRYTIPFNGTFDGQGHVIYGLYAEQGGMRGTEMGGLFGWTGDDAVIQNVGIEAAVIDAQRHNTVGQSDDHTWYYSSNQRADEMGMLAGNASGATIKQCYAIGRIYSLFNAAEGSFVYAASDSVVNCYARIDGYRDNPLQHDALTQAGQFAYINNCGAKMQNCYVAGRMRISGLSGSTSYYNKELVTTIGIYGTGKTTYEMHTMNAYKDWDFENVWARNDDYNDGYPVLRVFHPEIQNSPDPITVTGITLEETTANVWGGDDIQLHASVVPSNAANQKIHWTINFSTYGEVDENGLVHTYYLPSKAGGTQTVVVTATTDDGSFSKKCSLTIKYPSLAIPRVLKSRRIGETEWGGNQGTENNFYLVLNYEYIVAAYTTPGEKHAPVSWTSSNESLLTIEPFVDDTTFTESSTQRCGSMAIMRCLAAGSVTYTATSEKGYTASTNKTIKRYDPTGVSLTPTSTSVAVGALVQLTPSTTPTYPSYAPAYTWSSSNENVATVSDGKITGVSAGSTTITVGIEGTSYTATCAVTVTDPTPVYYTIRFLNYNGAVLQNSQVLEGDMPSYTGATPIKPADSEYTYSFNGWSPAIVAATADADYTAQYTATAKPQGGSECDPYVCDFTKKSGSHTAYTDSWTYDNDWIVFGGANNGAQWDYVKMGGKNTNIANANPVYVVNKTAFECEIASVKVTFPAGSFSKSGMSCNNWGVKVYSDLACTNLLYTVHGGTISKNAETLTVTPAVGQTWSAGYAIQVYWDLANTSTTNGIVLVSKIEYIPAASSTPVDPTYYTIRFLNWDDTELQNTLVLEGTMPSYTGSTPTKPADDEYTYSFNGWSPTIVAATADADYTAQFTATPKTPVVGGDCDPFVCDFTAKASSHSAYNDSWVYDTDWTVYGGANNGAQWDYVKMGGKSTTLATVNPVYVVNKEAFDCAIASVKVTYPAGSFAKTGMSCNDWGVKVYSDLACSQLLYTVNGGSIDKNGCELTITPATGQTWAAGYAIQVYWNLANTSTTNGIVLVSKIKYTPVAPVSTDIEEIMTDGIMQPAALKVLIDGQIYILRQDGAIYTLQGVRVK